jgi:small subunit ribosomal protein S8
MITSLVTDYLIRLKNGNLAGRKTIITPASKLCLNLSQLLKKNRFIQDYEVTGDTVKTITITLAYDNDFPRISHVDLISKPGRRFYQKHSSLPWGKTKESLIIISTSAGLMTQKEASVKKLGGEIFAEIY